MKNRELLLFAMSDMEEKYLMEAYDYEREKKRLTPRVRRVLIAAAIITALAITAGAVGLSLNLRQSARDDLGITEPGKVSGYTEYALDESAAAPELTQDAEMPWQWHSSAAPQLVSALSSDGRVSAYLSVPGVTQEMENALQSHNGFWDVGSTKSAREIGVWQTAYDAQTETALVKVQLSGLPAGAVVETFTLIYRFEDVVPSFDDGSLIAEVDGGDRRERLIVYKPVEIPATECASLHADVNKAFVHPNLDSFTAELLSVDVHEDSVTVSLKVPAYDDFMASLGDDAWAILGNATLGEPAKSEQFADYDFEALVWMMMNPVEHMTVNPNSPSSPEYLMQGATLNLSDGTVIELAKLERICAGEWNIADVNGSARESYQTGLWRFEAVFAKALDLDSIESITIDGVTYPLNKE